MAVDEDDVRRLAKSRDWYDRLEAEQAERVAKAKAYDPRVEDVDAAFRVGTSQHYRRELGRALHGDPTADLIGWVDPLLDGEGKPRTDEDGRTLFLVGWHVLDGMDDAVRESALWWDAVEHQADALSDPDLWHDLDGREDEVEVWTRRASALGRSRDFDGKGRPLAPCFDERDTSSRCAAGRCRLPARRGCPSWSTTSRTATTTCTGTGPRRSARAAGVARWPRRGLRSGC